MTKEERDIISRFIERVSGAQQKASAQQGGFGSVPSTAPAPLPPIDHEADALIGQLFERYPEARYRLTQTAFVQEYALVEAQNRIKRLEYELQQAQQQAQQAAQQAAQQPRSGGGFLSGIFGGGQQQRNSAPAGQPPPVWNQGAGMPPGQPQYPPPPQYAPGYQPGMFQRSGSGFLGSALTTAAGVAGGMVVGNAMMDMFSPHHALAGGLGSGMGGGFGEGGSPADASPWGAPAASDPGYVDQGSWTTPDADPALPDQSGYADQGSWDQASWDQGGGDQSDPGDTWDSSGGDGGGFDDNF